MKPRLLDLFCGAGGAAVGYDRAGFDVVGVDNRPQPRYPFEFIQADAMEILLDRRFLGEFAICHASPPCQDHSKLRFATRRIHGTGGLLVATRAALEQSGIPWVIENVPGAPMRPDYKLCGCMFGLPGLRRERWFETSWRGFTLIPSCHHLEQTVTVSGHGSQGREYTAGTATDQAGRKRAMGIDWMNRDELSQAIPPAYTEFIGAELLAHLAAEATA